MKKDELELRNVRTFIKTKIRLRRINYGTLAKAIGVSEITIKRWMSSRDFSIRNLARIGRVLGFSIFDGVQSDYTDLKEFTPFSLAQERFLVANPFHQLLLIKLRDGIELDILQKRFRVSRSKLLKILRSLEEMKLIEHWPNDKIKVKLQGPFMLLPEGPIASVHFALLRDHLFTHFRKNFPPVTGIMADGDHKMFRPFEFSLTKSSAMAYVQELATIIAKYDRISSGEAERKEKVFPVASIIAVDRHDAWSAVLMENETQETIQIKDGKKFHPLDL